MFKNLNLWNRFTKFVVSEQQEQQEVQQLFLKIQYSLTYQIDLSC